jgi:hypothetical protein
MACERGGLALDNIRIRPRLPWSGFAQPRLHEVDGKRLVSAVPAAAPAARWKALHLVGGAATRCLARANMVRRIGISDRSTRRKAGICRPHPRGGQEGAGPRRHQIKRRHASRRCASRFCQREPRRRRGILARWTVATQQGIHALGWSACFRTCQDVRRTSRGRSACRRRDGRHDSPTPRHSRGAATVGIARVVLPC